MYANRSMMCRASTGSKSFESSTRFLYVTFAPAALMTPRPTVLVICSSLSCGLSLSWKSGSFHMARESFTVSLMLRSRDVSAVGCLPIFLESSWT